MASVTALSPLVLLPPHWVLPWVAVAGLAAAILGARSLAVAAAILVFGDLGFTLLLAPWIATLPVWVPWLLAALMWLLVLQGILATLFGRDVAAHVTGAYLIQILDTLLLAPLRFVIRLMRGRGSGPGV